MRFLVAALLTPMLVSCGSSEPAAVDFDRPVAAVYGALGAVDGRVDMEGLLKSPAVARQQAANDRLVFLLGPDSAAHRGQITFRFAKLDEGRTRVTVDAELPEIKAAIGGETKVLSEEKIEQELVKRLQALAERMAAGAVPTAQLDELDQAIAFTALALDPREVNRALALAGNDAALAAAIEGQTAWTRDNAEDEDAAGAAMDATGGEEAGGDEALGDEAIGEEPEPDAEWDTASE